MDARFFAPNSLPPVDTENMEEALGMATEAATTSLHVPPLQPRDEAVFLLTAAAEIEQVLMVQYLFAAYSVRVGSPPQNDLRNMRDGILQIAREEMGHLITVQNLLHLVGMPLHLDRDTPGDTASVAPFTFTLERLSLGSLAKYVTAEAPGAVPDDFPDKKLLKEIGEKAKDANGGQPVRHVGAIFERLQVLFENKLTDADLLTGTKDLHGRYEDWGFQPRGKDIGDALIVVDFPQTDPTKLRAAAVDAIRAIGEQGEGLRAPKDGTSHFKRFIEHYKTFEKLDKPRGAITWPVVTNPSMPPEEREFEPDRAAEAITTDAVGPDGRITEPRARAWARLFDLRYRQLLGYLSHFLYRNDPRYTAAGDRTERGLLLLWTFDEMRHLAKIAELLVQLPKAVGSKENAGPPFGMPYSTELPRVEELRWRTHLDVSLAAGRLIRDKLQPPNAPASDPFLEDLLKQDETTQTILRSLTIGIGIPKDKLPTGFAKAVTILQEAVRGFTIGGPHQQFWADHTRDEFAKRKFGTDQTIKHNEDGTVNTDPSQSLLIKRVENPDFDKRMPRYRPQLPPDRIGYLKDWIRKGAPDDAPSGNPGVHNERSPSVPVARPEPGGEQPPGAAVGFAQDVKPLFRDFDRQEMLDRFDLFSLDDVRTWHEKILAKLTSGDMPCDGAWPAERIQVFANWIAGGMAP